MPNGSIAFSALAPLQRNSWLDFAWIFSWFLKAYLTGYDPYEFVIYIYIYISWPTKPATTLGWHFYFLGGSLNLNFKGKSSSNLTKPSMTSRILVPAVQISRILQLHLQCSMISSEFLASRAFSSGVKLRECLRIMTGFPTTPPPLAPYLTRNISQ